MRLIGPRVLRPWSVLRTRATIIWTFPLAFLPALVHSFAKFVVFRALFIIQNGANFRARLFLNRFESWLSFRAKVPKFLAGLFTDFMHLLALALIQPKIVVKLVDIPLCALLRRIGV